MSVLRKDEEFVFAFFSGRPALALPGNSQFLAVWDRCRLSPQLVEVRSVFFPRHGSLFAEPTVLGSSQVPLLSQAQRGLSLKFPASSVSQMFSDWF